MTTTKADFLVFTPHPDDAEFGTSGTVAKLTRKGKTVVYIVCSNGDKGTDDINMLPEELIKIREKEQLEAAKILGVEEVIFLRHEDQALEDTPEFRKEIAKYKGNSNQKSLSRPIPTGGMCGTETIGL